MATTNTWDSFCQIEYGVVTPIAKLSSAIVMLWFIYKYIESTEAEQNKRLRFLGFAVFCTQTMFCMGNVAAFPISAFVFNCSRGNVFIGVSGTSIAVIFFCQYSVMVFLLFYRLKVVFNGTAYQLSQCTRWTFNIMYILSIILWIFVSSVIDWSGSSSISLFAMIVVLFDGLLGFAIISFLCCLFVQKLFDVNKHCDGIQHKDENNLLWTITKQSLLTFISLFSGMVFVAIVTFLSITGLSVSSIHGAFVWISFALIDVWTNFICILLSYQAFDGYYSKMCGFCDLKCKRLCVRLSKPQKIEKIQEEIIESMSGHSVQCTSV